jgi:NAD(P)H-hydrate epimerase
MIVTPSQMKAAEEAAFAQGETPAGLMEIAGVGVASVIRQFFPKPGTLVVFCGKGHNGGDSLVVARHLTSDGWQVQLRLAAQVSDLAPLMRQHLESLPNAKVVDEVSTIAGEKLVLLDGLLGTGSAGAPRGVTAGLIRELNFLRSHHGAYSIAVDLPSGLDATSGVVNEPCVQADLTVTLGMVKRGLVADSATAVTGRLALVPLPGVSSEKGDSATLLTSELLRPLLPIRNFDTHKGTYGRIGLLAGSRGTLGAARLSSAASVHAGGGLVTLYALREDHDLLASLCIPEVMVQPVDSLLEVLSANHDVLAIGPGLGRAHDADILKIIRESPLPCVIDADALNALSTDLSILKSCAGPRLLSPHPGEMERLFPQNGKSRREWAEQFTADFPVTLLLKGARTVIARKGESLVFNSTGNPGMGTGGMGDVLTGVCAALMGGGHTPREAAMLGAWLCGRAAEIAIFQGNDSQESLAASAIIENFGAASESLRRGDY